MKSLKRIRRAFTALLLCLTMAVLPTGKAFAASKSNVKGKYISDIKVGMGETDIDAGRELLQEGYTILKGQDGKYADLNFEAGSDSIFKEDQYHRRIIYLGYKTTNDPNEAITDLAVMNMDGGYDTTAYDALIATYMDSQIKPFVDRFIAALKEYRENYAKPADDINHIRADFYRRILNKLTDDDTGGKPLGDLLLNQTKYEMGDAVYNLLSDAEKADHCDILTLLTQAHAMFVLLIETLIAKSTDNAEDTWIDRFISLDTETLVDKVKEENPHLTTEEDIYAELDRTYHDTATKILEKWISFSEAIARYDDNVNAVNNTDISDTEALAGQVKKSGGNLSKADEAALLKLLENNNAFYETNVQMEEIIIVEYMDEVEYGDGTLKEFFERERSEFAGEGIRDLYPIAAALSPGQIACLDFLSIEDLFSMTMPSEEAYTTFSLDAIETVSVYEDVDREIYKPGGVGMTYAELRAQKNENDSAKGFGLSKVGRGFWAATVACFGVAVITRMVKSAVVVPTDAIKSTADYARYMEELTDAKDLLEEAQRVGYATIGMEQDVATLTELTTAAAKFNFKSALCNGIMTFFSVVGAILAVASIAITFSELFSYYKVTFKPIPKYMVDKVDITEIRNGQEVVVKNDSAYYKAAQCNRKPGSTELEQKNYEILGTTNDLNGDVGKQWLSLYSVKYEQGRPILADSLKCITGTDVLPKGYETGIHRFGEGAAFNLTSEFFCYNDTPDGTFVYFKQDSKTVSELTGKNTAIVIGSIFSNGSLLIGAGVGAVIGAGAALLIITAVRRKKKEEIAA